MTIPAHTLHSSYANNTGTSSAFIGNNISSVVVPSVVDGMLLFNWSENPPYTPTFGTAGAQSFTLLRTDGRMTTWFLPQPEIGTFDITISYGGLPGRGAAWVGLMEGTHPTNYAVTATGTTGTSANASLNVTRSTFSGDYVYTCLTYPNRDSLTHGSFSSGGVVLYNTAVNSGGGVNSWGFVITQQAGGFGNTQSFSLGSLTAWTMQGLCIKNSAYNQASTLVIRHAP